MSIIKKQMILTLKEKKKVQPEWIVMRELEKKQKEIDVGQE